MRLTLRTLLAYLYHVLEPAESDQFRQKIDESEFASGLVQRIQAITGKPRMSAPKTDAKGLAEDANNVADYLDNSLNESRVGDFERTCLESDVHLAEVAASYQILTMVLGRPADVPEGLRQRIYDLPSTALNATATTSANSSSIGDATSISGALPNGKGAIARRLDKVIEKASQGQSDDVVKTTSTASAPEVPIYLRDEDGSRLIPLAIVATLLVLVCVGAIRVLGPFDHSNPAIGWLFAPEDHANTNLPGGVKPNEITHHAEEIVKGGPAPFESRPLENKALPPKRVDVPPKAVGSASPDKTAETTPKQPPRSFLPIAPADDPDAPPLPGVTSGKTRPPAASFASDAGKPPAPDDNAPPLPDMPVSKAPPLKNAPNTDVSSPKAANNEKPPAVLPGGDVGRFVSDGQVLARYDEESKLWRRVATRAVLSTGDRLVALPTYRPQIALPAGVQITLAGESAVQLEAPPPSGGASLRVEYGKLIVVTTGMPRSAVHLNLLGLKGTLTLLDADAELALEVRRYLPPGADPEKELATRVVEFFVTSGKVNWQMDGREIVSINANHVLALVGDEQSALSGPYRGPEWIDAKNAPEIDRSTSLELERMLEVDKPLQLRFQEHLSDRRVDVRALAARSLAALDQFDPLVKELSDARQYSFWGAEVESLRAAINRSPDTAAKVRDSLERLRAKENQTLFRLLWGYSPQQLAVSTVKEKDGTPRDGAARELLTWLENPEMDVRVLAIDNLRLITGAQLGYRPEKSPDVPTNRLPISKWRDRLKTGKIAYKSPPTPLTERKPLDRPRE